ncbi:HU family DNA-binding protein [Sulfitobacter mediterraneus]|uniref:HU family DNA-binding protein n=1 Tax=Sulfitobacter mediterraneus TaxID=83219 RepID=UPI001939280F|nr:HU family DNA-binding protein [Sulfitobacter mediterraneus]MBM1556807.1 HU family DNA-binding protein [Sulfitobacter mediterraneus]MBM1568992.1 HU family DNA-binding protein [Sulfitobacter mediterraneus]MBM1572419.1 HU family DNA-binding protein [Sulfitobacter mediterraneus]MBM1576582.1 HU family DNA-binding protein [Sulfitobacter mediterraneus]MBM1579765.1 HU family DNA-binding protein [Sulfitobacter mediterraneus]
MSTTSSKPAKAVTKSTASAAKPTAKKATTKAAPPVSAVAGKPPISAKTATPAVVDAPQPVVLGPMLRKKELIEKVVDRAGIKKKDAKPVIEAMLAVLGEALTDHREINLPELGRIKVRKEKMLPNGRVMITKIRQPLGGASKKLPDAAE